jgi:cytochrome c biogenesis protein CcmG, thiol:disulfide interchange protein DsbE
MLCRETRGRKAPAPRAADRKGDTMRSRKSIVAGLLAAVVLGAALSAAACGSSSGSPGSVTVQAPGDFSVAKYAGKPLVVNFFGSWCGPCNAEAPDLATFSKANPGAQFVGIAVNDTESDATAFMSKYGLSYPVVIDDNSLSAQYGITGVPTTIFFNGAGQEVDRIVGAASLGQFDQSLAKAQ